jgi:hypothetical protein
MSQIIFQIFSISMLYIKQLSRIWLIWTIAYRHVYLLYTNRKFTPLYKYYYTRNYDGNCDMYHSLLLVSIAINTSMIWQMQYTDHNSLINNYLQVKIKIGISTKSSIPLIYKHSFSQSPTTTKSQNNMPQKIHIKSS